MRWQSNNNIWMWDSYVSGQMKKNKFIVSTASLLGSMNKTLILVALEWQQNVIDCFSIWTKKRIRFRRWIKTVRTKNLFLLFQNFIDLNNNETPSYLYTSQSWRHPFLHLDAWQTVVARNTTCLKNEKNLYKKTFQRNRNYLRQSLQQKKLRYQM
jgi:hypothetical protein